MPIKLAQIQIGEEFTLKDSKSLNTTFGGGIRGFISQILPNIFVFAGLILLGLLIMGGIRLISSAGNPEAQQKSKGMVTQAVIGFIIIFTAFWIIQIIQVITGVPILNT